jgi:hypothetical protein
MRVIAIADTHGYFPKLPEGDILIHAGDATMTGTRDEIAKFDTWLGTLDYKYIIFTPGNHDFLLAKQPDAIKNAIVLISDTIKFCGLKIWASPYSPVFGAWAFMKSDADLAEVWGKLPRNLDILVHLEAYLIPMLLVTT